MQRILIKSIPGLVHLLITILFFDFLLNDDLSFIKIGIGAAVLSLINSIITEFVVDEKWSQLLISFCSFIGYFTLYAVFLDEMKRTQDLGKFIKLTGERAKLDAKANGTYIVYKTPDDQFIKEYSNGEIQRINEQDFIKHRTGLLQDWDKIIERHLQARNIE